MMRAIVGYTKALDLFKNTPEILEALKGLDTSEKAGFRLEIYIDDATKTAQYKMGHANMSTDRISQISQAAMIKDDYEGMKSWAASNGIKFEVI